MAIFRAEARNEGLTVLAHAGTNAVLLGMSLADDRIDTRDRNLAGFAIWRRSKGHAEEEPLANYQTFSGVTAPTPTFEAPIQKFRRTDVPRGGFDRPVTYRVQARYFTGEGAKTRGGPEACVTLERAAQSGPLRIGFTRGIGASTSIQESIRPPGPRRPDFDTRPYRELYEWLGGDARRLLFDFLADCERDGSAQIDVFAHGLDEPDVVAALCRIAKQGRRLRVILDDSPLHSKGSPEFVAARMIAAAAGSGTVPRGTFGRFR